MRNINWNSTMANAHAILMNCGGSKQLPRQCVTRWRIFMLSPPFLHVLLRFMQLVESKYELELEQLEGQCDALQSNLDEKTKQLGTLSGPVCVASVAWMAKYLTCMCTAVQVRLTTELRDDNKLLVAKLERCAVEIDQLTHQLARIEQRTLPQSALEQRSLALEAQVVQLQKHVCQSTCWLSNTADTD